MKNYRIFILFLISLIILLFIPNLLKRGMFADGLWYATISKNLSDGVGTFWSPCFTKTMYTTFNEHPPLVFGIQSFFFRLFGDSWYVEKIYSFFIITLTLILIYILWKELFKNNPELSHLGFIPCVLWVINENTYLCYPNNLLECTQGVFILIAVILILKGIHFNNRFSYLFIFIAGLCLILSFLSKGFTGLYPLATIIIYYAIFKNIPLNKVVLYNVILFGSFGLILLLYFLSEDAAENLNNYIETQVLAAIRGERTDNMQSNRFHIVKRLIETSILPLLLALIIYLVSFFKNGKRQLFEFKKELLFFVILGLSGVLPIMVSKKQATYYLITTIPFFSIAFSLILVRSNIINKLRGSFTFRVITYSIFIFSILYSLFSINKVNKRNEFLLHDMEQFNGLIEDNSVIGCKIKKSQGSLYAYFMRMNSISLDTTNPYNYPFLITDIDFSIDTSLYEPIDLETMKFSLHRKK